MSSIVKQKSKDVKVESVKIPPHSIEAEQAVIGGLMLDNQAWDKIAGVIMEVDFYRPEHTLLFRALTDLAKRNHPFDVLTVTEALKAINQLNNVGGEGYLFELANKTPSAANVLAYANIVRERSILRQLNTIGREISESALTHDGRSSADILDAAEHKIFSIAEQQKRGEGPISFGSLLGEAVEYIDALYHSKEPITGLSTGFHDLDDITSGLQKGDLVIVAGRPSMGKTILGMNFAEHAALAQREREKKKPILIFSLEMSGQQLAVRLLASNGRINQQRLRTGKLDDDDWRRITSAVGLLSEVPLLIDDTPALTPVEIRARTRRVVREHGELSLIVIDYLQLMQVRGTTENRATEIAEISRSLKALAKELNVPVVAISQLNRGLEQRTDKRPVMSDLRESGSIEQDADLIIFIYRDEVYNENSPNKGTAEIIIAKQRNGPTGVRRLTFFGEYARFENFAQM